LQTSNLTFLLLSLALLLGGCKGSTPQAAPDGSDPLFAAYQDSETYRPGPGVRGVSPAGTSPVGLTREEVLQLLTRLRRAGEPVLENPAARYSYRQGDLLDVAVSGHPEFSGRLSVRSDGTVLLPTVAELVHASGLRRSELRENIADRLYPLYLRLPPKVSVHLIHAPHNAIYVFGEVARPGRYVVGHKDVSVLTAFLAANGASAISLQGPAASTQEPDERQPDIVFDGKTGTRSTGPARQSNGWEFRAPSGLRPAKRKVVVFTPGDGTRMVVNLESAILGQREFDPLLELGQIVYVPSKKELTQPHSLGSRLIEGALPDAAAELSSLMGRQ
jgi:hypothetical protein